MTAPVIPVSSEELNEMLQTKKVMDEVYADPATFKTFLTNYARAANSTARGDIERIVEDRLQAGLASFAKETMTEIRRPDMGKATARDLLNKRQTGVMYNKGAMGTALDGEFENLADLYSAVHHNADRSEPGRRAKLDKMRNALSSNVPSEGGFLIPEEMRAEILSIALETAVMRPRARVLPMSSKTLVLPANDSTSNVSSNFGGVTAYWTEEGGTLVASNPTFSKVKLDAKKLTAYTDVPNELDDDAPALQAFLSMAFPETMAFAEDFAFLMGDGVGQPLGALNAANTAIIAAASGAGFTAGQIITMFSRMLPSSLNRAIWVISPDVLPDLYTITSGGRPLLLNNDGGTTNLTGGLTLSILGRPVVISEKVNAVNSQGDISFLDPAYYLIGDRMAMSAATSPHYKFGNDVTSYRLIERVDGRPWLKDPITPKNGGATLSAFVQLAANDRTPA